jgi:hypothetical protein
MATVPIKTWWDHRHTLNEKMATTLRNELENLRAKTEVGFLLETPAFGAEREERDRRNKALMDDLDNRIEEMNTILQKFHK